jgi:hypothetical protein
MRDFEEYVLDEGIKDWAKSFMKTMEKFHDTKNIDTDIKYLIQRTNAILSQDKYGKRMGPDKVEALNNFVKVLKSINLDKPADRVKLGQAEKKIKPILKAFNVGIKI